MNSWTVHLKTIRPFSRLQKIRLYLLLFIFNGRMNPIEMTFAMLEEGLGKSDVRIKKNIQATYF